MATKSERVRRPPAQTRRRARPGGRPRPGARYHHGALREALLEAAAEVLLEQGVERFTLRECARRAGVSHAAPAHHFGDVRGLLSAFATLGFERMTALMRARRAAAGPDPGAQLRAVGEAYLEFALAQRAHFQLMFRNDRLEQEDPKLQAAAAAAFEQLRATLTDYLRARGCDDVVDLDARLLLAWSVVHGFATLLLEDQLRAFRGARSPAGFARAAGPEVLRLLEAALLQPRRHER